MTSGRPPDSSRPDWIVIREGQHRRWGGDLRRRHIFTRLAERTNARIVEEGWFPRAVRRAALGPLGSLPSFLAARLPAREPKPRFAASEKLRDRLLDAVTQVADPAVVAVYDDPVAQAGALGVELDPAWLAELRRRQARNVDTFRWLVVPTGSFAELARLPLDRVIVGGNGTDTTRVVPGPWPAEPSIGVLSGAAPGRGLELLVEAARMARERISGLRLYLWLVASGVESESYLDRLRASVAGSPWITIGSAPYERLGESVAPASALCIAHPPNAYMDVALPVKLFDSLAAGRPLIVTPRTETAAVVERYGVGVVTAGDGAEDVASAIVSLLGDEGRTRGLGQLARTVAEREFDWRVVGNRIADEVLAREGPS